MTPALRFRDPDRARALTAALADRARALGRAQPVSVMHVCGSHEQAIAKFGLRASFPTELDVIMGPGCPVCVTDVPEIDEAVALAKHGVRVATYGDMLRVPGPPPTLSILSAHKYIPPVMEIVAEMPGSKVEGFLAAGHAATITGWGVFEAFVARHHIPVVVAGFEPLDILAGLVQLVDLIASKDARVVNCFPRCVSREGNLQAQAKLWRVFELHGGMWRGIAHVPNGNLKLRDEFARWDARQRFTIDMTPLWDHAPAALAAQCQCGDIMAGIASQHDCNLFGQACTPDAPVGACMVSAEGTCRIWHQYGGHPDLRQIRRRA